MKKNGFTLAEVLIALGLVGVLSAMTVPTMVKNNQNQVFSHSLSTAISDFEIAMSATITRENVSNLHETRAWENIENYDAFVENLSEIINITAGEQNSNNFYTEGINVFNGGSERSSVIFGGNAYTLVTKKGFTYHIRPIGPAGQNRTDIEAVNSGINLTRVAAWVFIDVNGTERPNRTARDIFGFILGNDGIMYPLGGRDVAFQVDNDSLDNWTRDNSTYACTNNTKSSFALGCTARLIDNNYRMDY